MSRAWVLLLSFVVGLAASVAAVSSVADDAKKPSAGADDQAKTPLQKVMIKMDEQTKAIQKVASSAARFKQSGSGKDIPSASEELVKLGKETRKFTEPAEKLNKPKQKWEEYTDEYIAASLEMGKVAKKKDFQETRKALKSLDSACTNCHGLFRPKTGGDDF